MGQMKDRAREATALEILEESEVLHEFEDSVTLRVERELWEEFLAYGADKDQGHGLSQ